MGRAIINKMETDTGEVEIVEEVRVVDLNC
jgi:hypothetical protein